MALVLIWPILDEVHSVELLPCDFNLDSNKGMHYTIKTTAYRKDVAFLPCGRWTQVL